MIQPLVKATDQNLLKTQASLVGKKPKSDISTPLVQTSTNKVVREQKNRGGTYRQLRIDRKATASEVNALSTNQSHSRQEQVGIQANANPSVKTSRASLSPYPETSGTFRISRKATILEANPSNLVEAKPKSQKHQNLPLAKAASQLSASTVQTKANTSANPHSLVTRVEPTTQPKTNPPLVKGIKQKYYKHQDLPLAQSVSSANPSESVIQSQVNPLIQTSNPSVSIQPKIEPHQPQSEMIQSQAITLTNTNNPIARVQDESEPNPHQDLPLVKAASQLSPSTVQTKANTSANPHSLVTREGTAKSQPRPNLPLFKGIIQTQAAAMKSQSTVSTRSIVPVIPHSKPLPLSLQEQKANLPIQLSQEASVASNPTVVSTKPTQLSSSSELKMVWLKSTNDLQTSEGLSTTTQYSQKMLLPLAISQISTNGAIARQTNAVDNSTVQLTMQSNATTLMPSTETASGIDITKVAEQVSRILARQLAVERERRGIGR